MSKDPATHRRTRPQGARSRRVWLGAAAGLLVEKVPAVAPLVARKLERRQWSDATLRCYLGLTSSKDPGVSILVFPDREGHGVSVGAARRNWRPRGERIVGKHLEAPCSQVLLPMRESVRNLSTSGRVCLRAMMGNNSNQLQGDPITLVKSRKGID